MKVEQQQSGQDGSFYIEEQNKRIAESRYMVTGDVMDIYHTQVSDEYQGKHLGDELIKTAVDYARQHQLKITPSCSFAGAMFGRHQEFRDVLAKS
ncbi:GNAT family N-acetyltransferase [Mucilaginibacter sp.]